MSRLEDPETLPFRRRLAAPFSPSEESLSFLLLALVVLQFVVYPFFTFGKLGKVVIDVFFSFVLVSGILAVRGKAWRLVAIGLAACALVTRWATYVHPERGLVIASVVLSIVFLVFASVVVLARVFGAGRVTRHQIEGAVAVYLLVGLLFGLIYALIAMFEPEAFDLGPPPEAMETRQLLDYYMERFSYYSFITLTTVGYGDVTPLSSAAKQMAVLEGLIGQLYPAILLARLVSMELAARRDTD